MIFYVGDIHGRVDDVAAIDRAAIAAGVDIVVQVGDFGALWASNCPIAKYFAKRERQGRAGPAWYTCGGNHENWAKWLELQAAQDSDKTVELAPGCFYVIRGSAIDLDGKSHIFFGGAESTDRAHRVEGVSWWAEESPSAAEFNTFFESMEMARPEIVVTHDAPICVEIDRINRDTNPTPKNLQNVMDYCDHAPVDWYFGHHHVLQDWQIKGINFHCCGFHGEYKEGRNG